MKPNDPNQISVDMRYRNLLILWFAMCMSVVMFMVLIQVSPRGAVENRTLTIALNTLGIVPVALSFLLKQRMLNKSVETQQPALVQSAYVLSFALCEVSALFALVDHFVTGSAYYYIGFAVAVLGLLLHFPQKKHLLAAARKEF